jgi:hypothetical protein
MVWRLLHKPVALSAGAVVVLAGAGVLGWLFLWRAPGAHVVDKDLERAVLPVIDGRLRQGPWKGMLATVRPDAQPKWFCAEHVIEMRHEGSELKVGLTAVCEEYGRSGDSLVMGSGSSQPYLVTLAGGAGHYQVQGVEQAKDGSGFGASVKRMFSPAGYVEFQRRQNGSRQEEADLRIEAKATFGLPPDAPVATR